jgi:hypothetical protein
MVYSSWFRVNFELVDGDTCDTSVFKQLNLVSRDEDGLVLVSSYGKYCAQSMCNLQLDVFKDTPLVGNFLFSISSGSANYYYALALRHQAQVHGMILWFVALTRVIFEQSAEAPNE